MATLTTYDRAADGLKRSVEQIIANIAPEETPAFTIARKTVAEATLHEFAQEALAAANPDNAAVQGAAAAYSNPTPETIRSNRTQIFQKTAQVSGTLQAVKQHSIANQLSHDIANRGKELKRDIEAAMVGRTQGAVTGTTSTGAKMQSILSQISSNTTDASATGGVITEAAILAAHSSTYAKGGNPSVMLIPPGMATTVAGFATASGRNRDIEGTELINAVDLIVSPFGTVTVTLDKCMLSTSALLVDPEYLHVATLRPLTTERMAKDGDRESVQIKTELTAYASHDEAHALINVT